MYWQHVISFYIVPIFASWVQSHKAVIWLNVLAELRDLAQDSLGLLRQGLYDPRFPGLFSLEVYGSIMGMFELNNLGES